MVCLTPPLYPSNIGENMTQTPKQRGLVVVDAWKNILSGDAEQFPFLSDQMHSFGSYLNEVCRREREKGTLIIHSYLDRGSEVWALTAWEPPEPMDEIEIYPEDFVDVGGSNIRSQILEARGVEIGELYWCGFHFGKCVHERALLTDGEDANIVLNLSQIFPTDLWRERMKGGEDEWVRHDPATFNYFLWGEQEFERITLLGLKSERS